MKKRIMVCLSGGLDSSSLLYFLKQRGDEVDALFIDRGQGNRLHEREAVTYITKRLQIPLQETSLMDWRRSWPKGVADFVVPRNAVFVLAALPFARNLKSDEVALGCNVNDGDVPDGNADFVDALNALLKTTEQKERAVAPFLDANMGKADVYRYAMTHLGQEFVDHTWSCYRDGPEPCDKCRACTTRKKAVAEARADPSCRCPDCRANPGRTSS